MKTFLCWNDKVHEEESWFLSIFKVPSEREPGRYVSYNVPVRNKNHLLADDKVRTFRVFSFDKLNSLTNVATIYKNKNHERPRDLISAIRLQVWKKSLDLHDYSTPQSLTRAYPVALALRNSAGNCA